MQKVVVGLQRVSIKSPGAVHPHLQAHTMLAMRLKDLLPQVGAANIRGGLQCVVVLLCGSGICGSNLGTERTECSTSRLELQLDLCDFG